jgi:hypothetical protein
LNGADRLRRVRGTVSDHRNGARNTSLDGAPAPITDSQVADTIVITKAGERGRALKTMKGTTIVGESRARLSADGKVLTVMGKGLNPAGQRTSYTAVYDKQ